MAEADRERWNGKYRAGSHGPVAPSVALTELERWVPSSGRALDVAGGTGGNAIWLAQRGLEVTVVDISEVGLARAVEAGVRAGVDLRVAQLDLEEAPLPEGPFALVLCSHYLQRDLIPRLARVLAPGGVLLWLHPTVTNLERHAKPGRRFLLELGEAERLAAAAGLGVVWSEESWVGQGEGARHLARVVARRES